MKKINVSFLFKDINNMKDSNLWNDHPLDLDFSIVPVINDIIDFDYFNYANLEKKNTFYKSLMHNFKTLRFKVIERHCKIKYESASCDDMRGNDMADRWFIVLEPILN